MCISNPLVGAYIEDNYVFLHISERGNKNASWPRQIRPSVCPCFTLSNHQYDVNAILRDGSLGPHSSPHPRIPTPRLVKSIKVDPNAQGFDSCLRFPIFFAFRDFFTGSSAKTMYSLSQEHAAIYSSTKVYKQIGVLVSK